MRVLDLADNGLADSAAAAIGGLLQSNASIEALDLSHNHVGPLAVAALAQVVAPKRGSLLRLHLAHSDIGDRECAVLARALYLNTTLTLLDLSHNRFSDRGAVALGAMLAENAGLEVRSLSDCRIDALLLRLWHWLWMGALLARLFSGPLPVKGLSYRGPLVCACGIVSDECRRRAMHGTHGDGRAF